jgi:hypothetical protein
MSNRKLLRQTVGLMLAVLLLAGCGGAQPEPTATPMPSGEVQFSTGCDDEADPWTPMSQEERMGECKELISSKTADLEKEGFEPKDCQVTKAEVQNCGLGIQLVCTYMCGDNAR